MPELAEVAYFARQWDAAKNRPILAVQAHARTRVFRRCDVPVMRRGLRGTRLLGARTHGKQMLFEFSGGHWLGVHLGMTGELTAMPAPFEPGRHDHLVLQTQAVALVFCDPRQFGSIQYVEGKSVPESWRKLPPQPMEDAFTPDRIESALQCHARTPLKALLLDQRYFPGIGNWMADEILWQMKSAPTVAAGSLDRRAIRLLWRTTRRICEVALDTIGKDWGDPPRSWLFRHRWGRDQTCPRCGATLRRETLRGRTASWCPVCQGQGNGKS